MTRPKCEAWMQIAFVIGDDECVRSGKINTIHYGGAMLGIGVGLLAGLPLLGRLLTGRFSGALCIPGGLVLAVYLALRVIETRQDFGKISYDEKHLPETVPFDPIRQIPVIRASICTGEQVAGFKDRSTGHFTEAMLIRGEADKQRFMRMYGIEHITTEY